MVPYLFEPVYLASGCISSETMAGVRERHGIDTIHEISIIFELAMTEQIDHVLLWCFDFEKSPWQQRREQQDVS